MSKLEHVETMILGSSLNCLDSETLEELKITSQGEKCIGHFSFLEGTLFILPPDFWEIMSLVLVQGKASVIRQWRPVFCVFQGSYPVFVPFWP